MDFETWVDMVKKEFYTEPWVLNCIKCRSITKERFEKYLQEEREILTRMHRDVNREWERRENEFAPEGYTLERFMKDKAIAKAHCLYLMYHD